MLSTSMRVGPLVIGAAILIAACGGGGTLSTASPSAAAPSTAASAAAPSASDAGSPGASEGASAATGDLTYDCTKGDGQLNGAGSTFIFPLLSKMGADYSAKCGVKLNYQSIGSGGGVKDWQTNTVDFGASDAYLADTDIQAAAANGDAGRDPDDVRRGRRRLQPQGTLGAAQDDARHHRRHLPRQDHDVERPGDRGPEPGADPAVDGRSASSTGPTAPARRASSRST